MPITRRQFELGIDQVLEEWMERIYRFLDENKDKAFTLQEIGEALELSLVPEHKGPLAYIAPVSRSQDETHLIDALGRLIELNVANERDVAGVAYYATGRYSLAEILEPTSKAS